MATTKKRTTAIKTYRDALAFLFSNTNYETAKRLRYNKDTFDLNRMEVLLEILKDPHKKVKTIHIAGTKGKGSTCTMLSEMLQSNDYKVGLYTSPHVLDMRERIQVDGEMITRDDMIKHVKKLSVAVKKMADNPPTFFEIMTAIAFCHFVNCKVDFAVIETGMGGRLDSTNVIIPEVVGITSLSMDHQAQLGDTIDKIAMEKAGIFKEGIPSFSVMQDDSAMKVLKKEALRKGTSLKFTGKDIDFSYRFESSRELGPHNRICLTTPTSRYEHLPVPLLGEHQAINCGLALSILDGLKCRGFAINDEKVVLGLANTALPGRMEIIHEDPRILVDGAHNAASIKAVIQATGQHIPYDSMVVIFGCCEDKDVDGMLQQLQYGADKVIFTRVKSPRSVDPDELVRRYTDLCGKMCQAGETLEEALEIAKPAISTGDLICITGSFYLVGQAKEMIAKLPKPQTVF
ncbi:MAG: bifunctional folylpolyglutamate synthase/dihydrofolate synthase [Phycisphaerae bacterium]|nr:bifunctional folylpolyglutamate synthase/dihydrofolate synthase [Phycisphaerae bacterium]